ncbi:hypothetical protein C7R92_19310 [Brevibacillus porteri]|uniref:Secreted protein n=1 Tax=Brevibacillus porteri TaxID=2126350 RepID=A0ABX5FPW7_9BACL|nr:hypothetical protein C7R92_19310 [Brevibacillus porteri]
MEKRCISIAFCLCEFLVYASAYAPQGGIDCPLRKKWRERFKRRSFKEVVYKVKLKFPAIFSYARVGSRGAWTGNSLLPT